MITEQDLKEIGKKYNIEFKYGSTKVIAYYTNWRDCKKYYKRRPGKQILLEIYMDGEKEWRSWNSYKSCEDKCTIKSKWGYNNNMRGYGKIIFPRTLETISRWRVEDFLEGNTMSPMKLGTYEMYLNNKEDIIKYMDICVKNHEAMKELQEDETFKGCLNKYSENMKAIEVAQNSNTTLVKKLQTIIQRKAKIETDSMEE
ncbi:MAG: hypothetical protein MJ211_09540 [Bacteroidales bacterium]|nr:hypothetical protein [Bacteroidales bacterium]